jgi:hypothetical protein
MYPTGLTHREEIFYENQNHHPRRDEIQNLSNQFKALTDDENSPL